MGQNLARARSYLEANKTLFAPDEYLIETIVLEAKAMTTIKQFAKLAQTLDSSVARTRQNIVGTLRYTNANAYVYVLQRAMRERGKYTGPLNGRLTSSTIKALQAVCQTAPATDVCIYGPLSGNAAGNLLNQAFE